MRLRSEPLFNFFNLKKLLNKEMYSLCTWFFIYFIAKNAIKLLFDFELYETSHGSCVLCTFFSNFLNRTLSYNYLIIKGHRSLIKPSS